MAYTTRELLILEKSKLIVPEGFFYGASDEKILAYADLVVNDMNWWPPVTNYDRNSLPDAWFWIMITGMSYFAQLFKQMEATLQDFNYNDNGLSVNVDQVGKISTAQANMLKIYSQQIEWMKKSLLLKMGEGLGTPRFQSQIGQFLKIALGQSFNWH